MARLHYGNRVLAAIGRVVRSRREELRLSQEEAAWRCKMDRTYFGGIERGERNMTVLVAARVASGLELRAAELMGGVQ